MADEFKFCPRCGATLVSKEQHGKQRRLCEASGCGFVHWGNPVPVVAAIIEHEGQMLLARAKDWPEKMFALVTGFLEAGETPEAGVLREVKEETNLDVRSATLVGAYEFLRMNQVIIAYHVVARGEVKLSPELVDWRLYDLHELKCWPAGTGYALADWLRTRGHEPVFFTAEENEERRRGLGLPKD